MTTNTQQNPTNTWHFSLMYFSVFMLTGIVLSFLLRVIPALGNIVVQLILSLAAFYLAGFIISRLFKKRQQRKMQDEELKKVWLQSSTFINAFQIIMLLIYIPALRKLEHVTPTMLIVAFMFSVLMVLGFVYLSLKFTR